MYLSVHSNIHCDTLIEIKLNWESFFTEYRDRLGKFLNVFIKLHATQN